MTPSGGPAARMQCTDRELLEQVARSSNETAANVKVMAVKLFGSSDADDENDTGRLPKVEKTARRAHERVDRLDRKMAFYAGGIAALLFVVEHYVVPAVK